MALTKQTFDMQRIEIVTGYLGALVAAMGDSLQEITNRPTLDPCVAAARGLSFRHMAGEYLDELSRLTEGYYLEQRVAHHEGLAA